MQPQNTLLNDRLRQIIIGGLTVVGIGLLLGMGGKAMSEINDPAYIYGKQRTVIANAANAVKLPLFANQDSAMQMGSASLVTQSQSSSNGIPVTPNEANNNQHNRSDNSAKAEKRPAHATAKATRKL